MSRLIFFSSGVESTALLNQADPTEDVSKWDQWQSIPVDVRSMVNSCVVYNNCGKCYKCVEFEKLINQHA